MRSEAKPGVLSAVGAATKRSAYSTIEHVYHPILLLALTPWFLQRLGSEGYGYWMMVVAVAGIGGLAATGTSTATIRRISGALGGLEEKRGVVGDSFYLSLIGSVALCSVLAAGFFAYLMATTNPQIPARELGWIVAMGCAVLLFDQIDQAFSSALKADDHWHTSAAVEMVSRSIQLFACAGAAHLTQDSHAVVMAFAAGSLARATIRALAVAAVYGPIKLEPRPRDIRLMLREAKWGWLQGTGGIMFGVADRIVVGALLGPAVLGHYSIATYVTMQLHVLTSAASHVLLPMTARTTSFEQGRTRNERLLLSTVAAALISSAAAIAIWLVSPHAIPYWLDPKDAEAVVRMVPPLAAAYCFLAWSVPAYYVLLGMGRIREVSIWVLLAGLIALASLLIGIEFLGVDGISLGRVSYAVICLALIPAGYSLRARRTLLDKNCNGIH